MGKELRKIIRIDEELCDGCGICAEACHEGAIQMIDGKAVLVSEIYCDGLGDCIGECPRGAISFEEREAEPYDEEAVKAMLSAKNGCSVGCPGTMAREIKSLSEEEKRPRTTEEIHLSGLRNWPVQLKLVPEEAPYLRGANIVIAADCTAFSHADFHRIFLGDGTVCLIGCPKLDDSPFYEEKIKRIIEKNRPESLTVVYMVVPCCSKLVKLIDRAIEEAFTDIDYTKIQLSLEGAVISKEVEKYRFR